MVRIRGVSIALALLSSSAVACASSSSRECNVGSDCASGACSVEGMCVALPDSGPGADAGTDARSADASSPTDSPVSTDGSCIASDSGTILQSQVVFMAGLHATFLTADDVTVSTAGETLPDGSRVWDFSGALPGDKDVLVETLPVTGAWYAASFPQASYASQLSDTSSLLGLFQFTSSNLLLEGVVSPDAGATQTKLTYSPAVSTLQFPLNVGASWSTNASVTGTADGVPVVYTEDYTSSVDAQGTLKTPLASFEVLRVGTVLTRTVGIEKTVIRTFIFVTDCYGSVATITSQDNESSTEFTTAAEIQRIAP
jgi:hypothetical protein